MRIGIDARLWDETGVGRYTRNLIQHLQVLDKKNEYFLFVLGKNREKVKSQIPNPNFQIVTADVRWHSVAEQKDFLGILNRADLDLMHFPYFSIPILYNKPFVVTIHDLILHHYPTGEATTLPYPFYRIKLEVYKRVIKQAAKKAKKIIAVSQATKEEIVEHLFVPEGKIAVIYEGIETTLTKKIYKRLVDDPYFLHVGNLYPHKNMKRLADAFSTYRMANPKTKLVIVGKKDYFYNTFSSYLSEKGISDNVLFFDKVDDETLAGLYQHTIAVVIPSLMEGFGLPAVEGMANRCIVLASDIPSLREVCKGAAIYFDPKETVEIAKALEAAQAMPKQEIDRRIELGVRIAGKYSFETMGKETLALYESCISVRSGQ